MIYERIGHVHKDVWQTGREQSGAKGTRSAAVSAGSSKGDGLPKHRSLPNDNLYTNLGELNSAGWTRAQAARRGSRL